MYKIHVNCACVLNMPRYIVCTVFSSFQQGEMWKMNGDDDDRRKEIEGNSQITFVCVCVSMCKCVLVRAHLLSLCSLHVSNRLRSYLNAPISLYFRTLHVIQYKNI